MDDFENILKKALMGEMNEEGDTDGDEDFLPDPDLKGFQAMIDVFGTKYVTGLSKTAMEMIDKQIQTLAEALNQEHTKDDVRYKAKCIREITKCAKNIRVLNTFSSLGIAAMANFKNGNEQDIIDDAMKMSTLI